MRYRSHLESRQLAPGTINLRLGAVRRLSADLAAGIRRVKGVKKLGIRLGNRLTAEQGNALWHAPLSTATQFFSLLPGVTICPPQARRVFGRSEVCMHRPIAFFLRSWLGYQAFLLHRLCLHPTEDSRGLRAEKGANR